MTETACSSHPLSNIYHLPVIALFCQSLHITMDPLCGIRNISHIVKLMQMLLCHMLEFYATVPRDIQFRIKCSPENKRNAVYRLLFCDHHLQIKKFGSIFKGVNDFYSIVQPVCTGLTKSPSIFFERFDFIQKVTCFYRKE